MIEVLQSKREVSYVSRDGLRILKGREHLELKNGILYRKRREDGDNTYQLV